MMMDYMIRALLSLCLVFMLLYFISVLVVFMGV
jgi:hypothetical protein